MRKEAGGSNPVEVSRLALERSGGFHTDSVPAKETCTHTHTHIGWRAADKNTNERRQVENVSTVVLIDLTDTSSVSQRRRRVTQPSALLRRPRVRARVRLCHSRKTRDSRLSSSPSLYLFHLRELSDCLSSASVVCRSPASPP